MDERIVCGLHQSCGDMGVLDMFRYFGCGGVGGLGGDVGKGLGPGSGAVGWCYVCVCLDSRCTWQVQVYVL